MFVKHNSGVFRLVVTQIIRLISSILVFIYMFRHKCYLNYSVVRLLRHYSQPVT